MALDRGVYFVSVEIARRTGIIRARYRIADGRFVVDNKDLSRVRFTAEEYMTGLTGIERTTDAEAQRLIAENGYKMGEEKKPRPVVSEPEPAEEPTEGAEPAEETPADTVDTETEESGEDPAESVESDNENENIEEDDNDGNDQ